MNNHLLEAALSYASLGWRVFPCAPGKKTPLTPNGLHDATTDEKTIRDWWALHPRANVAINCGASNLAVIDLDMKNGVNGIAAWEQWCAEHDLSPNGTATARTPSGGRHLVYTGTIRNSSSKLAPGIDTRGVGGYIVAAPSQIDGVPYRWEEETDSDPLEIPRQITDALTPPDTDTSRPKTPLTPTAAARSESLADLIMRDGHPLSQKGKLNEFCGPCPWCGGHDRFVVSWEGEGRDGDARYFCRRCERSGDAVSWLIDRKGLGVVQAKDARGVEVPSEYRKLTPTLGHGTPQAPPPSHLYAPITAPSASPSPSPPPNPAHPLTEPETSISWLHSYRRVEFPMILENMLPAGIVGGINAEGGTGKTYLTIAMFAAIATGLPWGPFTPTRPHKVLLLLAEDPKEIVQNRLFDIAASIIPHGLHQLLEINLHIASVRGSCGPLMSMNHGNPTPSAWADWLDATIRAHTNLELLGLDPLRKFYGLDENKNEFAHAFIGLLESISLKHSLGILYNHHVAKAAREDAVNKITGRGAGGLSDNCRWMAAMRTVDQKTAEYLELEGNPSDYIEFAVTKSNYAPILPRPAYFKRGAHGVLAPATIDQDRLIAQIDYLANLIDGLRFSIRDLVKESRASDVRAAMKERFSGFKKEDFHRIVEAGVRDQIFTIIPLPSGPRNVMRDTISVTRTPRA